MPKKNTLETDKNHINSSINENIDNNEPTIEKQNNDSTIQEQHNVETEVEDVLFKTSIIWYTDDEISIQMMDGVNKNIFSTNKTPKDLQKLSIESKLYLETNYLYDLLVAGFEGKNKDVILIINQQVDVISIKIMVKLPLDMVIKLQLFLDKKEQNDVERIELIAKDIFKCKKQLVEKEKNISKENKEMKNAFSNSEKKIDCLEDKIEIYLDNRFNTEKMEIVAIKNYLIALKNSFDTEITKTTIMRTEIDNQKVKLENNCINLWNELEYRNNKNND